MLEFFRDTLSGMWYIIYIAINVLFIFALIGVVGERKTKEFATKQKQKELDQLKYYESHIAVQSINQNDMIKQQPSDNVQSSLITTNNNFQAQILPKQSNQNLSTDVPNITPTGNK